MHSILLKKFCGGGRGIDYNNYKNLGSTFIFNILIRPI